MEHQKINQLAQETLDSNFADSLALKHVPKTSAQRTKPFYHLLTWVGYFAQIISFTLASSGMLYLITNNMGLNGSILVVLALVGLVFIESFVWWTTKLYHAARLDDKHVSKAMLILLVVSYGLSTPLTYIGTPSAIAFFSSKPLLIDMDRLSSEQDNLRSKDSLFLASQINGVVATVTSIQKNNSRKDGTIRSAAIGTEQSYIKQKLALESSLVTTIQKANENKAQVLASANLNNEITKQNHISFCQSFGAWLSWITVAAMLVLFAARWWVEGWERLFVVESAAKAQDLTESIQAQTDLLAQGQRIAKEAKDKEDNPKVTEPQRAKVIENQQPRPIAFAHNGPQEGDIIKGEGKKRDRVLVIVDGKLSPRTFGEINSLIGGQSAGSPRVTHLESLKKLLQ